MVRARRTPLTDALDLAAQVRARAVSPRELVDDAVARIEAANPKLNFLVTECFEQARGLSQASGPFAGVPMLVKDLTETAGLRTTFSSKAFADYVPAHDAAVTTAGFRRTGVQGAKCIHDIVECDGAASFRRRAAQRRYGLYCASVRCPRRQDRPLLVQR